MWTQAEELGHADGQDAAQDLTADEMARLSQRGLYGTKTEDGGSTIRGDDEDGAVVREGRGNDDFDERDTDEGAD